MDYSSLYYTVSCDNNNFLDLPMQLDSVVELAGGLWWNSTYFLANTYLPTVSHQQMSSDQRAMQSLLGMAWHMHGSLQSCWGLASPWLLPGSQPPTHPWQWSQSLVNGQPGVPAPAKGLVPQTNQSYLYPHGFSSLLLGDGSKLSHSRSNYQWIDHKEALDSVRPRAY